MCLAFLDHLILKRIDHKSIESLEKLWGEMHHLVSNILKREEKYLERKDSIGSSKSEGSSGKGTDYEIITTDTS